MGISPKRAGAARAAPAIEPVIARSRLLPDQAIHLVRKKTQTKKLEPYERAKLHNALPVGAADTTEGDTASGCTTCRRSSCCAPGVDALEVRRVKDVLRFSAHLQVEPLGELEDSSQAGVKLPQAWSPEPRFRPANVADAGRGKVWSKS